MDKKSSILIIDDEAQIRRLLQLALESNEYKVVLANNGNDGMARAAMDKPDLIILDLGLPDADGIDVLKKLREWATMPILILSVRNTEEDIVAALDAKADDYLIKPFRTGELLARVRTALRHHQVEPAQHIFTFGSVVVDLAAHTVKKNEEFIKLTATEYSLLSLFVRNAGKVLTHNYILEQVWGHAYADETQYTRVYLAQLRKKLEDDPANPKLFLTESGIGYRLAVND
jgi:two-component system KDP operon response regulator KdpE